MKHFIAGLCLLLCSVLGFSQNEASPYDLPTIIPSSPEVSSILRYSEVPVSYYNGVPNISVPIYTLQGRELAAPINLSYHAGGHRVNEEASRVGLGWSLSAGGQISRVVRGLPDDNVNGFIHTSTTVEDLLVACQGGTLENIQLCELATELNRKAYDLEPDDFNYSMLGLSGRFMFNQKRDVNLKGEIIQFPDKKMKITPTFNETTIIGWILTDTNGTIYEFSQGNKFISSNLFSKKNGLFELSIDDGGSSNSYIETWNLTKVTSLNGDELTFEYSHEFLQSDNQATRWEYSLGGQNLVLNPISSWNQDFLGNISYQIDDPYLIENHNKTRRYIEQLSKITSSNGYVMFVEDTAQRLDINSNAKRLEKIEVYNNSNEKLQEVEFIHDYFESTPRLGMYLDESNTAPSTIQSTITRRLYLKKLQFKGGYNSTITQDNYEYNFDYNTTEMLPDKQSYAQDHWGYYNGAVGNTSLITYPSGFNIGSGQNREVNQEYSTACMLNKITYPEGGVTKLYYENNRGDIKNISLPPYMEQTLKLKAIPSTHHTTTQSGLETIYKFENTFTISDQAKPISGNPNKVQVSYNGFTDRCADVDEIYDIGNLVCNNMFIKIYKVGNTTESLVLETAIWNSGYVSLDMDATYRIEIEITSTNQDNYNMSQDYSEVTVKWLDENTTTINPEDTFDYFGGVRIQAIKTYDNNKLASYKSFEYSGGYVLSMPLYLSYDNQLITTNNQRFYYPIFRITSSSSMPLKNTQSGYVGYTEVKENIHNIISENISDNLPTTTANNKFIVRTYSKANDQNIANARMGVYVDDWVNGNLLTEQVLNKQLTTTEYISTYSTDQGFFKGINLDPPISGIPLVIFSNATIDVETFLQNNNLASNNNSQTFDGGFFSGYVYNLYPGQGLPKKQISVTQEGDRELTQVSETFYESAPNHYNPTKTVTTDSKGDIYQTIMSYPYEENHTTLLSENRINVPLVTTTSNAGTILSTVKSEYDSFHGKQQVARILGAKESGTLEERVTYHDYTSYGQPREVSKTDGTHITYIWGYNYTYPVAKIDNATYTQVSTIVNETNIQNLTGVALENALAPLRADLPNAMVTTYDFEPMIGMTKSTDPRGRNTYYKYDIMGRLEFVLDHDGNVLSQNKYHYKNN